MLNHLERLRILQAAAESSSFREAALRLGISPQGVTRAVRELEEHFGEPLFHRSTRQVRITAFGERLVARSRELLAEMEALLAAPGREPDLPLAGRVRITAPRGLGRCCLVPALARLAAQRPGLSLDLRLSDAIVDVVDEQIDLGVRIGFPRDSRFVARKAGEVAFRLVAAPQLVARTGAPGSIEALAALPTSALVDANTGRAWPWYFAGGRQLAPASSAFVTDDAETELDAILAGVAYGQVADYLATPLVRAGRLVAVLEDLAPAPWGIYVYRPQRGPVPPRVRLVFDHVVGAIAEMERNVRGG